MKSTERFSNRVADYVKFRPHYPTGVFAFLRDTLAFRKGTVVADIGSGTGISTKPLLELGCTVFAVEPNAEMRRSAEEWLREYARFVSISGTAEETALPEHSVDAILEAQAFHWFDAAEARREFIRILKPRGRVVLLWNDRLQSGTLFLEAYERLIREFGTDYDQVRAKGRSAIGSDLGRFFGDDAYRVRSFEHQQDFDFAGLKGRLLSSSYAPANGHPNHERMIAELGDIFERCSTAGVVRMLYETNLYFGRIETTA